MRFRGHMLAAWRGNESLYYHKKSLSMNKIVKKLTKPYPYPPPQHPHASRLPPPAQLLGHRIRLHPPSSVNGLPASSQELATRPPGWLVALPPPARHRHLLPAHPPPFRPTRADLGFHVNDVT